jgi:hypothetical protein
MKIVVNHLTRMKPGYICVAGIDQSSGRHVRPVLKYSQLTTDLLQREGGPFGVAAVVDLGETQPIGSPPEVEDQLFQPDAAEALRTLTPSKFWKLLDEATLPDLRTIFGDDLKPNGRTMAVDLDTGAASLGCLRPRWQPAIEISYGKVKVGLRDGGHDLLLPVTDLRVYKKDQQTPNTRVVSDLDRRLRMGTGVILSVGLTRPWQKPGDTCKRHFLQVNNLHLEDDPTWVG